MFIKEPGFKLGKRTRFIVAYEPGLFYSQRYDLTIEIPLDFNTNFASIPWIFRRVFNVNDDTRLPATLHDLVWTAEERARQGLNLAFEQTNLIFLDAMLCIDTIPKVQAYTYYHGVGLNRMKKWNWEKPSYSKKLI